MTVSKIFNIAIRGASKFGKLVPRGIPARSIPIRGTAAGSIFNFAQKAGRATSNVGASPLKVLAQKLTKALSGAKAIPEKIATTAAKIKADRIAAKQAKIASRFDFADGIINMRNPNFLAQFKSHFGHSFGSRVDDIYRFSTHSMINKKVGNSYINILRPSGTRTAPKVNFVQFKTLKNGDVAEFVLSSHLPEGVIYIHPKNNPKYQYMKGFFSSEKFPNLEGLQKEAQVVWAQNANKKENLTWGEKIVKAFLY